jgi:hypothetical protein
MKTYKIDSTTTIYQDELTIEQDACITNLLTDLNLDNVESLQVKDLLKALTQRDFIIKFFSCILINNDHTPVDEMIIRKKIKNKLAVEIVKDFFSLNAELLNYLKSLISSLAPVMTTLSPSSNLENI